MSELGETEVSDCDDAKAESASMHKTSHLPHIRAEKLQANQQTSDDSADFDLPSCAVCLSDDSLDHDGSTFPGKKDKRESRKDKVMSLTGFWETQASTGNKEKKESLGRISEKEAKTGKKEKKESLSSVSETEMNTGKKEKKESLSSISETEMSTGKNEKKESLPSISESETNLDRKEKKESLSGISETETNMDRKEKNESSAGISETKTSTGDVEKSADVDTTVDDSIQANFDQDDNCDTSHSECECKSSGVEHNNNPHETSLVCTAGNDNSDSESHPDVAEANDVESNFATIDISDSLKSMEADIKPSEDVNGKSGVEDGTPVTALEPVRDTWHVLFEIRNRELGYGGRFDGLSAFSRKACGSVQLAQRLIRYTTLDGHSGCVNALHFNESGTLLASGSDDLSINVWKWMESKSYYSFDSGHRSNVFQCKFMPYTGDCHMVSCARDGQVRLAELSSTGTCRGTKKLASHRGAAHKLAMLCDSSHVFYSCGEDAVIFEIDLRQEKPNKLCITKESNRRVELYSIQADPFKSHEFVVGGRDSYVRVYDARNINENTNGGVLKKFCPPHMVDSQSKANITCAVYNFDGTEILGSYNDEDIYLFSNTEPQATNHYLRRYTGHRNSATVKGVNFYGPKSEFIVSGSDCGNVFVWEKNSERIVNYFAADEGGVVNVLEPHPNFAILATSGLDHDVKVWMPLAEEPTDLNGLDDVMKKNRRERETDNTEPDIDSQMFWLFMRHVQRSARRQWHRMGEDAGSSSSADSDDLENDDEDNDGEGQEEANQCNPS